MSFNTSISMDPSHSVNLKAATVLPLASGTGFFKAILFPNINKIAECELLIMGVQQLEDTSRN